MDSNVTSTQTTRIPVKWVSDGWRNGYEMERLTSDLRREWEANHFERCGEVYPHPRGEDCMWPMPDSLARNEGIGGRL